MTTDNNGTALAGQLVHRELTGKVIGAFFETYETLGFGFLEAVYRNALALELRKRGLHVQLEAPVAVTYKGVQVGFYRCDLLVEQCVTIEVKATSLLAPTAKRQLVNCLTAAPVDVGLLLHYGPEPKFYRLVSPRVLRLGNQDP